MTIFALILLFGTLKFLVKKLSYRKKRASNSALHIFNDKSEIGLNFMFKSSKYIHPTYINLCGVQLCIKAKFPGSCSIG